MSAIITNAIPTGTGRLIEGSKICLTSRELNENIGWGVIHVLSDYEFSSSGKLDSQFYLGDWTFSLRSSDKGVNYIVSFTLPQINFNISFKTSASTIGTGVYGTVNTFTDVVKTYKSFTVVQSSQQNADFQQARLWFEFLFNEKLYDTYSELMFFLHSSEAYGPCS